MHHWVDCRYYWSFDFLLRLMGWVELWFFPSSEVMCECVCVVLSVCMYTCSLVILIGLSPHHKVDVIPRMIMVTGCGVARPALLYTLCTHRQCNMLYCLFEETPKKECFLHCTLHDTLIDHLIGKASYSPPCHRACFPPPRSGIVCKWPVSIFVFWNLINRHCGLDFHPPPPCPPPMSLLSLLAAHLCSHLHFFFWEFQIFSSNMHIFIYTCAISR